MKKIKIKCKNKLKSLKLKWKVFAYLLGFCGIFITILWTFQVLFLEEFYIQVRKVEVNKAIDAVNETFMTDEMFTVINDLAQNQEIFVTILDSYNNVLYGEAMSSRFEHLYQINLPQNNKNKQQTIRFNQTLITEDGVQYELYFNALLSPVAATVSTLGVQLLYITVIMIIFSIILALFIAKRISSPIEQLNERAKALAKGNYEPTFNGMGFKEISELSDTLNYTTAELSKVENLRKELIANISHDLRTPLTLITGYAEMMRDLPDENNVENAQIIIDETTRLTTLVNDLLDLSKLQSGALQLSLSTFNFTASIKSVIKRVNELVKKEGYHIEFQYEEELTILADEVKLSQVFYNLLINAIHYTGPEKKVVVVQTQHDQQVKIQVIDFGEGIEESQLPYIWQRYYKIDKTHKRAIAGTGIGLSIVKQIVELHSGQYGVNSKVGEGSTFWFSVPQQ
ncbi:MAG TPA: two-component sensor histidine kinase [Firmicutes bacterium]|nr:two-component sensor histidine kinase [Bacillota bacterium]